MDALVKCGDIYLNKKILKDLIAVFTTYDSDEFVVVLKHKNGDDYPVKSFGTKEESELWMDIFVRDVLNDYVI